MTALFEAPPVKAVSIATLPPSELTFAYESGPEAAFLLPAVGEAEPRVVTVRTDGTVLRFFPERSAGHREVLKALGL
jgi:hypothetical protein